MGGRQRFTESATTSAWLQWQNRQPSVIGRVKWLPAGNPGDRPQASFWEYQLMEDWER
jgi:hypothetical protein